MKEFEQILTETESQIPNKKEFAYTVIVMLGEIEEKIRFPHTLLYALEFLGTQKQRSAASTSPKSGINGNGEKEGKRKRKKRKRK